MQDFFSFFFEKFISLNALVSRPLDIDFFCIMSLSADGMLIETWIP
jgi:hypothetical protein